jgi:hypothetical protein
MAEETPDQRTVRAALRGKRVALGVVIAATVIFILATALHVIPAVFGAWISPIRADDPRSANCAKGLRELVEALDRDNPASRDSVQYACSLTPEGLQAWASFERLRVAGEQLSGRDPEALAQLKRDLAAHLPSNSR